MKFSLIAVSFFGLMLLLTIFYPFETTGFISPLLQVSTLLFAIFTGFSITDRERRIDEIREKDSIERANMILLYRLARVYGNKIQHRIKNVIDKYVQATLDFKILDYYKTENEFKDMTNNILSLKVKTQKKSLVFDHMLETIENIGIARKQTIALIEDKLSLFEWTVFLLLSGVLIISLLLSNPGTVVFAIVISIISTSVILVLFLLYKLNSLTWKEEIRIFEPYQRMLEAIGLLRYYPEVLIKEGRIKQHVGKPCRIASYPKSYPDMSGKKITIVYPKK